MIRPSTVGSNNLKNVMLPQSLNEIRNVGARLFGSNSELFADRVGNLGLAKAMLQEFEYVRTDQVEAENSATTNVEKHTTILGPRASNCFRNCDGQFVRNLQLMKFYTDGEHANECGTPAWMNSTPDQFCSQKRR